MVLRAERNVRVGGIIPPESPTDWAERWKDGEGGEEEEEED